MLRVASQNKLEGFTEFEEQILFDEDDPDFVVKNHHTHLVHHPQNKNHQYLFCASSTTSTSTGIGSSSSSSISSSTGGIIRGSERIMFRETTTKTTTRTINVPSNMSLASVHPADFHSSHSSLTTLSHSLEDINLSGSTTSWNSPQFNSDHVMTIEELRLQMTSCFTCGVSWNDSHVSLDCTECGGYALERPCPNCDGICGSIWKRDLSLSHASSKARWQGECCRKQAMKKDMNITSNNNNNNNNNNHNNNNNNNTTKTNNANNVQELSARLEKLSANS